MSLNDIELPTTARTITREERMLDRMNEITELINRLYTERAELGRQLPPVRYKDLVPDGCNFRDLTFSRGVDKFMQERMTALDTTLLDRDDPDKWELLTPRYEVREVEVDETTRYGVWDHVAGEYVKGEDGEPLAFEDESDADDKRCDLEADADECRYGFPFAWNTGWVVEKDYWLDELRDAGFLVYRYDGDTIIAGIDGGGYSFKGAHFAPLYATLAAKHGWMIETNAGPRFITME